ncbi:arsenate reductase (glutaredoxin) [Otariodibacter sp.]|uniref:arsenate reductase (glutaredoxin) n=1 Tax=Otariodibacter sp. TaxID=3030919 RepID=UPI00260714C4|nr:arsenate reductase (glutaredoxin) [Otariodibacter sp.]
MSITIYHNPKCSKSRETLALIREAGIEPTIVEYLKTPVEPETIKHLIKESGISIDKALRTEVDAYHQYIEGQDLAEDEIIQLMSEHATLINRPFVTSDKGTRFCRPPELVKELL